MCTEIFVNPFSIVQSMFIFSTMYLIKSIYNTKNDLKTYNTEYRFEYIILYLHIFTYIDTNDVPVVIPHSPWMLLQPG